MVSREKRGGLDRIKGVPNFVNGTWPTKLRLRSERWGLRGRGLGNKGGKREKMTDKEIRSKEKISRDTMERKREEDQKEKGGQLAGSFNIKGEGGRKTWFSLERRRRSSLRYERGGEKKLLMEISRKKPQEGGNGLSDAGLHSLGEKDYNGDEGWGPK